MPNVKISELSASVVLEETDYLPIISGGLNYRASITQLLGATGYPAHSASMNTFSASLLAASASFRGELNILNAASASFRGELTSLAGVDSTLVAASASFLTSINTLTAASASFRGELTSLAGVDSTLVAASASYRTELNALNAASASFVSDIGALETRANGSVVLAVSGTNTGDILLTGSIFASGSVYRRINTRVIEASGPILLTDQVLFVSSSVNVCLTATNPAALPEPVLIKKTSNNAIEIQIARYGSENIEGAASTYILTGSSGVDYPGWTLMSDGFSWWIG